jgi:predicted phage terminase large subunit-like protein
MEALYGGAAGGGKSEALLFEALSWCDTPGYKGLIIRRTYVDMMLPSSILNRCLEWLRPYLATKEVRYDKSQHTFYFPSGAELAFGYLKATGSQIRYQSSEYNQIFFDELTHFQKDEFVYLFSRMRKPEGCPIPAKMRAGSNPGGPGHIWVKDRFGITKDEDTGEWYGTNPEAPFLPAKARDNPSMNVDEYEKALDKLGRVERERLKNGDWDATADALFDNYWFINRWTCKTNGHNTWYHLVDINGLRVYRDDELTYFTTIDCAASQATGVKNVSYLKDRQPSHSVIATWGLTRDFDLIWLDNRRFQVSIPELINRIGDNQKHWKPLYNIIEKNGPGEGVYQISEQRGYPVKPIHSAHDKIQNSIAAQLRAEKGKVWLPAFKPWLRDLENELYSWTGSKMDVDDQIDVLSNACNEAMEMAVGHERDSQFRSGLKRAIPIASGGKDFKKGSIGGKERQRQTLHNIYSGRRNFSEGLNHLRNF